MFYRRNLAIEAASSKQQTNMFFIMLISSKLGASSPIPCGNGSLQARMNTYHIRIRKTVNKPTNRQTGKYIKMGKTKPYQTNQPTGTNQLEFVS